MLRIRIANLKEGVHRFDLRPAPTDLDLDPAQLADITVQLRLDYYDQRILASFEVQALATLECDRTLKLFTQPVKGKYTLLYAPPEVSSDAEEQFDDMRVLMPSDQEIDLTDAVRDTLLLALPVRRVAPEAEHLEIQLRFGEPEEHEAEMDPRWEALRRLGSNPPEDKQSPE